MLQREFWPIPHSVCSIWTDASSHTCSEIRCAASLGSWHWLMTSQISWLFMMKLMPSVVSARKESCTWCNCIKHKSRSVKRTLTRLMHFKSIKAFLQYSHPNHQKAHSPKSAWSLVRQWRLRFSDRSLRCYASWPVARSREVGPDCSTSRNLHSYGFYHIWASMQKKW